MLSPRVCRSFSNQYEFDNVTAKGGQLLGGVLTGLSHVGYQNDLNWNQFNLVPQGDLNGFVEQSSPNTAAIALQSQLESGSASLSPSGTVIKSAAIKGFTPIEVYFACNLDSANSDASTTTPCTIAATGYDTSGNMV